MSGKTIEMTLLFDFFGDLLTEKQRYYFDLYYNDDLSLSEIAELDGITRQGVRDTIMRAEAALTDYESKTGVVSRFNNMQAQILSAEKTASEILEKAKDGELAVLAEELRRKLELLKG